jgi:hypothetical protein
LQRLLPVTTGSFLEAQFQSFPDRSAVIHGGPQRPLAVIQIRNVNFGFAAFAVIKQFSLLARYLTFAPIEIRSADRTQVNTNGHPKSTRRRIPSSALLTSHSLGQLLHSSNWTRDLNFGSA